MKGDPKVIETLNEVLTAELTGVNQYFIHAKMCANWGYQRLAAHVRGEAIDEMKHAEQLIERILFLEGHPNMQRLGKINVGETVPEQFKLDLAVETAAVGRLNKAIAQCVAAEDNGTREMLEGILTSEEEHVDWIETQIELIRQLGEAGYLAEQMHA